jgi:hypothetical protein
MKIVIKSYLLIHDGHILRSSLSFSITNDRTVSFHSLLLFVSDFFFERRNQSVENIQ